MTSALRCSHSRLASGADEWVSTSVFSSIARTVAPASITSVVRLRWRTLSRTVGHMDRTAAALSSPGAAGAGSGTGAGAGSGGGGTRTGSGTASGLGTGGADLGGTGSLGGVCSLRGRTGAATADGCAAAASAAGIDMSSRVSIRSTRCSSADSVSLAEGSSSRAQTTSSSRRGAVAPRISPSPACTTSA